MIIISNKTINHHLKLHVLAQPPLNSRTETPLQRLNLLTSTRQFKAIASAAQGIKEMSFPNLAEKLKIANAKHEQQKQKLGLSKCKQILKQLDAESKKEDPNFQRIDDRQAEMFQLSKILFEEGSYKQSAQVLKELQKQDLKQQLWLKVTWARIYCEIILKNDIGKLLENLKKKIEDVESDELAFYEKQKLSTNKLMKKLYSQKEQFLLLTLLETFRTAEDEQLERFVDYCTSQKSYFSILQLTSPELLRYITVAIVLNKSVQNNKAFDLFKLSELINRKYVKYSDCFTDYIYLLEVDYDFEEASAKIEQCKSAIRKDPLLAPFEKRIVEGLHFLYFKRACKIYDTIELSQVAAFTGLPQEEAELWILGYIRSGDIDAKIDSIAQLVVSNKGKQNPYQKYLDVVPSLGAMVSSLSRAIVGQ